MSRLCMCSVHQMECSQFFNLEEKCGFVDEREIDIIFCSWNWANRSVRKATIKCCIKVPAHQMNPFRCFYPKSLVPQNVIVQRQKKNYAILVCMENNTQIFPFFFFRHHNLTDGTIQEVEQKSCFCWIEKKIAYTKFFVFGFDVYKGKSKKKNQLKVLVLCKFFAYTHTLYL